MCHYAQPFWESYCYRTRLTTFCSLAHDSSCSDSYQEGILQELVTRTKQVELGLSSSKTVIGTPSFTYTTPSCRYFILLFLDYLLLTLWLFYACMQCVLIIFPQLSPLASPKPLELSLLTFMSSSLPSCFLVSHWVLLVLSAGILADLVGLTLYRYTAVSSECNVSCSWKQHFIALLQPLVLTCFFCDVSSFRCFMIKMESSPLEDLGWARGQEQWWKHQSDGEHCSSRMLPPFPVNVDSEWGKNEKSYQN